MEYDTGTEPLDRLLAKVDAYAELATATDIDTPVLFWLPGPGREAALHQALRRPPVTVATATPASPGTQRGRCGLLPVRLVPDRPLPTLATRIDVNRRLLAIPEDKTVTMADALLAIGSHGSRV